MDLPAFSDAEALFAQGVEQATAGNWEGMTARYAAAIALLLQILDQRPEQVAVWRRYALALEELERYEESLAVYDQALAHHPEDGELWNGRGHLLLRKLQRYEAAIASYDRRLALKDAVLRPYGKTIHLPDVEHNALLKLTWQCRGMALEALGQEEAALESYIQADYQPRIGLLQRSLALKRRDQIQANYPEDWQAWYETGCVLAQSRSYEDAIACYDRALAIQPDDGRIWKQRADALWQLHQEEAALVDYNRAVILSPQEAPAWAARGALLQRLKQHEAALESAERAIRLANASPLAASQQEALLIRAWRSKAAALEALGQDEAALAAWEQGKHPYQVRVMRQKLGLEPQN